ncbi:MAG: hydantoinase B/oxoprolinase family protein [Thermoanaerobaculia bacterium]|nr:hydantoinase B/oxoprolinase family protein [Thermoanaerobaculia bacterium]
MPARPVEVELALFTHRFAAIAAEMGEMLQRTALSTNVRDRLDFSCALLDREGRLVVNAPHIPVHLGALGLCVRKVAAHLEMRPGDTVVTNHPGFGGSHLPDITVITPVFQFPEGGELLGYVANRCHHAEIGGIRSGSMPPSARFLVEEGVVLEPLHLVRGGEARWEDVRERLTSGPWPSRTPDENLADLHAALAANLRGVEGLRQLAAQHGLESVHHYMDALRRDATRKISMALSGLRGSFCAEQCLDDGTLLRLAVECGEDQDGPRCVIDFEGSGDVHPGNLNATPAIVRSAVLYVLRLLVARRSPDADVPLNEGLFEPVELRLPGSSLLSPDFSGPAEGLPAVVGGNVETSQRVVDTLLHAFDLGACSQGTMNNVLFGDDTFGYYETVCGGTGAGDGFDGTSAVHSHMTNTRITDPEILEQRYPVRLEEFAIRHGSGGDGHHRGGDGVVRRLRFLRDVELSILSQHRVEQPYGLHGGGPGTKGRQILVHPDGSETRLAGISQADVRAGDLLVLETPGGGGWGRSSRHDERVR